MKLFFCTSFISLAAADRLIYGVGSSYAAGVGLTQNIGDYLATALHTKFGGSYTSKNIANPGSNLSDICNIQAPQLKTLSPEIIYMVSGGNDLNYVTCLDRPSDSFCNSPISEATWQNNFKLAVNSIFQNVANPTQVILYILTYPLAIGADSGCPAADPSTSNCPLASISQLKQINALYNLQVNYTVDGHTAFVDNTANSIFQTHLVTMRSYSVGPPAHDVGSSDPWVWGRLNSSDDDSNPFHPNADGASNMANYIYLDYISRNPSQ